ARDAWVTLAQFTQRIPGNSERLYQDVVSRVQVRDVPTAGGTRLDAVQEALNHLTKRGITGFRDNRGRNWSLTSYLEMKSRTIVNQTLI
ncbi:phage minor capsid protein, partial [Prescottella equi]|uniref:phage minor capsid protein n=1 Tax=Rhodococcus hoagii TaxID=43767 RepID=UPI001F492CB1